MAASKGAVREGRPASFYWLAAFFGAFVLFLYGPMIAIFVLSFQGPDGRPDLPVARPLRALVPKAVGRRRHRRHQGRVRPLGVHELSRRWC